MSLDTVEALERAANALDAASEAVGCGLGDRPQLADMLALWLMEEGVIVFRLASSRSSDRRCCRAFANRWSRERSR